MQQLPNDLPALNGALLINKPAEISSFGVIEALQRELCARHGVKRSRLPKLGHGGTLDPFATGLLIVCVGKAVKLARYFLGSQKSYEGMIRFGETTIPGDPTAPISETSETIPGSLEELQHMAKQMALQAYLQTPPMHSAKKRDGKPLYELARAGIEVEREPKLCHLYEFAFSEYQPPRARFHMRCSSGTYVRVLAQDFARLFGSVALVETLHRTRSGSFDIRNSCTLDQVIADKKNWAELPCWIPFDQLLDGFPRASATAEEAREISQGKQQTLFNIVRRAESVADGNSESSDRLVIYEGNRLLAIASRTENLWSLERVFPTDEI
ncbi:MAG: tRNA pseudouridine(55) synthase TruB [Bdellovibrionales bacterium GWB1_55_8]|nr:MAG: tRNA pseudouridine(55) synthase TruB [Bdellovibrionales bacterium GWB1_55_8]